jgi:hypothetical protein
MGIQVEYNPDLALRNWSDTSRRLEERIPELLEPGKTYAFLKKGQRLYWLLGELPLVETKGNQQLSKPLASVMIVDVTHFMVDGEVWTKGHYKVVEVFDDDKVHFDGFTRI